MAKVDIDFKVHSNPYYLGVLDLSDWQLIEDEPSIVEITLPGYSSCITHYFDKCKNNIFNSINLKINCTGDCGEVEKVTLPDGIYTIQVKGSPDIFNKKSYYLKTDLFDMEVDKLFINHLEQGSKNRKGFMEVINLIRFLISGAEASLKFDDLSTAGSAFKKAQDMIDDLKNCKNCFSS